MERAQREKEPGRGKVEKGSTMRGKGTALRKKETEKSRRAKKEGAVKAQEGTTVGRILFHKEKD